MPIQQRDYYQQAPTSGGGNMMNFRAWSITGWLIAINIIVFFLDGIPGPTQFQLSAWGYFSVTTAIYHLQIWRFITFQFLHANVQHIMGNMLFMICFGPIVEPHLGARKYLAFYLLCGIAGTIFYMLLCSVGLLVTNPSIPMVGASAGIFGLIVAAMRVAPLLQLRLALTPVTFYVRTVGWVCIGIAVYMAMTSKYAGGEAAHLGGGLLGWYLIRHDNLLNFVNGMSIKATPGGATRSSSPTKSASQRGTFRDWTKDF
jgi:membrane associated rhomboid family serine protease